MESKDRLMLPTQMPEYAIWKRIHQSCYNRYSSQYKNCGALGIKVAEEWSTFRGFLRSMGRRPDDRPYFVRRDKTKDFCPSNCIWGTLEDKNRYSLHQRNISFNGETHSIAEWSKKLGIRSSTISSRLRAGWPLQSVFGQPSHWKSNRLGEKKQ
ncbi:MAG: hypothetical protein HF312_15480 [Ignavibacteria bacterium]|jgi:hypothetical protein|nr:hypothetical protein [Ignavibacteria bacterium]